MPKASFEDGCLVIDGNGEFKVCVKGEVIDNWIGNGKFVVDELEKAALKFCKGLIKNSGKIVDMFYSVSKGTLELSYENESTIYLNKYKDFAKVSIFGLEFEFGTNGMEVRYNQKVFVSKSAKNAFKAFMNRIYGKKIDFYGEVNFKVEGDRLDVYVNGEKFASLGLHDYEIFKDKFVFVKSANFNLSEFIRWVVDMYNKSIDSEDLDVEIDLKRNSYSLIFGYLKLKFKNENESYKLKHILYEVDGFELKLFDKFLFSITAYDGDVEKLDVLGTVKKTFLKTIEPLLKVIEKDKRKDEIFKYLTF